jgi:hypothetical protein
MYLVCQIVNDVPVVKATVETKAQALEARAAIEQGTDNLMGPVCIIVTEVEF